MVTDVNKKIDHNNEIIYNILTNTGLRTVEAHLQRDIPAQVKKGRLQDSKSSIKLALVSKVQKITKKGDLHFLEDSDGMTLCGLDIKDFHIKPVFSSTERYNNFVNKPRKNYNEILILFQDRMKTKVCSSCIGALRQRLVASSKREELKRKDESGGFSYSEDA